MKSFFKRYFDILKLLFSERTKVSQGAFLVTLIISVIKISIRGIHSSPSLNEVPFNDFCSSFFNSIDLTTCFIDIIIIPVAIFIIFGLISHIDMTNQNEEKLQLLLKKQFKMSSVIINDINLKLKDRANSEFYQSLNDGTDKVIQAPLGYVLETLNGNVPPKFEPDADYIRDIYTQEGNLIVAITAENPNLWLDPTICFYMANCYAASLNRQASADHENKKLHVSSSINLETEKNNRKVLLKFLSSLPNSPSAPINDFKFVRFFLFTEEQNRACQHVVFPTLKAAQDLFGIESFFISRDCLSGKIVNKGIKESKLSSAYNGFAGTVRSVWDEFANEQKESNLETGEEFEKIINERKENVIPEFLMIFRENITILHSYINGKNYTVKFAESDANDKVNRQRCLEIVAFLANYCKGFYHEKNQVRYVEDWHLPQQIEEKLYRMRWINPSEMNKQPTTGSGKDITRLMRPETGRHRK